MRPASRSMHILTRPLLPLEPLILGELSAFTATMSTPMPPSLPPMGGIVAVQGGQGGRRARLVDRITALALQYRRTKAVKDVGGGEGDGGLGLPDDAGVTTTLTEALHEAGMSHLALFLVRPGDQAVLDGTVPVVRISGPARAKYAAAMLRFDVALEELLSHHRKYARDTGERDGGETTARDKNAREIQLYVRKPHEHRSS